MLRLELMPLVSDFGEGFYPQIEKIDPQTHLKFTRDDRIFGQFSNFPDTPDEQPKNIIRTRALPKGFTVRSANGLTCSRTDNTGQRIHWVYAEQLKTLKITRDASPINKAIMAYIYELPDDTRVLLRWD